VPRPRRLALLLAAALAAGGAVSYAVTDNGVIGPKKHETGNGRVLHPAGRLTPVGNFPTGGAVTRNGRFYWAVSTGRGFNDIRIVNLHTHRVVQTLPIPGASGGIVMDPTRNRVYVSGVADSAHLDEQRKGMPGRGGDVIFVYRYKSTTGKARYLHLLKVPPPSNAPTPQNFPPTNSTKISWPDRLAITPDGKKLLVPLNLADAAAIVNTKSRSASYISVGHYPYGAAISPNGKTGLVSNETDGTVSVVDMASAKVTSTITVGPKLSHPEGITVNPRTALAYVSMANTDHVVVIDMAKATKVGDLSLVRRQGLGVIPVSSAVDAKHHQLYVAEEGGDDVAVLNIRKPAPKLVGRVPTAAFPTDVAVSKTKVVWLSAKGFGYGPNPTGPIPTSPHDNDNEINTFTYLPSVVRGDVGVLPIPTGTTLQKMTARANRVVIPVDRSAPPADTPLRPNGPIKHVFYIVKENRTYDQILGDIGRGDSDPKLELFNSDITPNVHAIVQRFPLLDHVYANSEASIDGHFWTSAGEVSDYVQKNWMQNYASRGRPYDFGVYSVTFPGTGFLFDQAQRQGISYFNYGEAIAGDIPVFPDKDRDQAMQQEETAKFSHSDLGAGTPTGVGAMPAGECYPNDADIEHNVITMQQTFDSSLPPGAPNGAESRFDCFKQRFDEQVAMGAVPAFNYLVLPNDHTVGTSPGKRTPQAMVADNDYGLGQIVDEISHSSIWSSSAIFVVEDDSQDGADHVDAHRMPAEVISPYTKPGAVIAHRYDFLSVIRSMELIVGMEPLGLQDAVAEPMYAVFTPTAQNTAPYTAIVPKQDRLALNPSNAPDAQLSASLDFSQLDQVPQRVLDRILWHAVYGEDSTPPPPGPNGEDMSDPDGR
jgi:YVTN family beta-propeller protein